MPKPIKVVKVTFSSDLSYGKLEELVEHALRCNDDEIDDRYVVTTVREKPDAK